MIITKTPFRMSFFGGGTDFEGFYKEYGGAVISTSFDKYCYVSVRRLPPFFQYCTEISYSRIERVKDIDEIEHPVIRNAMKYLNIKDLRITYEADLPARSGLGTSSSFAVGLLNAFYALDGKYVDKRKLADDAIYIERVLCKEAGGIQDQIATAFGGLNRIDFNAEGYKVRPIIILPERKKRLNDNLMLFFTGFSRFSSDIQTSAQNNLKSEKTRLFEMYSLVDDAEKILNSCNSDLDEFGRLLDYTWKLKRGFTNKVSTESIDAVYEKGLKAGAIGGKLLGAGGGGFLLFYVQKERQKKFLENMKELLYVPFSFENDGAKVIYYVAEQIDENKIK